MLYTKQNLSILLWIRFFDKRLDASEKQVDLLKRLKNMEDKTDRQLEKIKTAN